MQHFRTVNGEPPNGAIPPGTAFYPVATPVEPAAPVVSAPPSYCVHTCCTHLGPRLFLPQQAQPAPQPAAARWTAPGASLLGNPAPSFDGVDYLYPQDHTLFHVIWDRHMKMDTPIAGPAFEAKLFPSGLTVKDLVQRLGAPDTDDSKYGVMEVHEKGDGMWTAGQTILLSSDYAKKTLREIGWDEKRGFSTKPVWIKVHTEA
ncbi:MAG: hypothetical protein Q9174_001089 [Haloplaca sp. 1 TL-2023]